MRSQRTNRGRPVTRLTALAGIGALVLAAAGCAGGTPAPTAGKDPGSPFCAAVTAYRDTTAPLGPALADVPQQAQQLAQVAHDQLRKVADQAPTPSVKGDALTVADVYQRFATSLKTLRAGDQQGFLDDLTNARGPLAKDEDAAAGRLNAYALDLCGSAAVSPTTVTTIGPAGPPAGGTGAGTTPAGPTTSPGAAPAPIATTPPGASTTVQPAGPPTTVGTPTSGPPAPPASAPTATTAGP